MIKKFWILLSLVPIVVGVLDITGWWGHVVPLILIGPFHVPLTFNAAFCFVLSGLGMLCAMHPTYYTRWVQTVMGAVILLMSALTIGEDIFNVNLHIDELCATCWVPMLAHPGRMAINSSLAFILTGLVLIIMPLAHRKFFAMKTEVFIFLIFLISMLGILGYLLNLTYLYIWYGYASLTPVSSLCFLCISIVLRGIWKRSPWAELLYKGHEDKKIILISSAILLCVSLVVGLVSVSKNIHLILPMGALAIVLGLLQLRLQVMPLIHRNIAAEAELRRANLRLRESEERYALAFKGSQAGVWDWTVGAEHVFSSPYLKAMLGYAEHEMPDTTEFHKKIMHPDDVEKVKTALRTHLTSSTPLEVEYRLKTKVSGYHWFRAVGQAVWDEQGNPVRVVGSMTDISEQKKIESLKNDFVSLVSTELKSPLTSVRSALGILLSDTLGVFPDNAKTLLRNAKNNCDRLYYLLSEVLDVDKVESEKIKFKVKVVDVHDLVTEAINVNHLFAEKNGIKLRLAQFVPGLKINVEPEFILQVLTNLISNAVKFSPRNGEVKIIISQHASNVRVSVADQGSGIPEEFQPLVFQKYFHVDANKDDSNTTVLGLKISKVIIEKFGGSMNFSSSPQGTVFYFELPRSQENGSMQISLEKNTFR